MDCVTFVDIILPYRFVLDKLDLCSLLFLLRIVDRWPNLKVDASLCQCHEIGDQFSFEVATKDRVALFRDVSVQDHPIVSQIRHRHALDSD